MNKEDFERLKAKLGDEFEIIEDALVSIDGTIAFVRKKDIWDGVEFFDIGGITRKIKEVTEKLIVISNSDSFWKNDCKPSTEQAYIEQLKKEAHERFGEIKEGDTFMDEPNGFIRSCNKGMENWYYSREKEALFAFGARIYQQGKWATRAKERVKVDIDQKCWATISKGKQEIELTFLISKPVPCIEAMKTFLADQLEAYLNLDGYSVDVSDETLSIHVKIRNGVDLEDLKEKAESLAKIVKKI